MKIERTEFPGLSVIHLDVFRDERGFFVERFHERHFDEMGLPTRFVQDNHSRSEPGVLRGLHFQFDPPQAKVVGVARGKIWDVALDLRPHSPTFRKHFARELSEGMLVYMPFGFAHGFCVLGSEPADLFYKVDQHWAPGSESGIRWNDPEAAIPWPIPNPLVSPKDETLLSVSEAMEKHGEALARAPLNERPNS